MEEKYIELDYTDSIRYQDNDNNSKILYRIVATKDFDIIAPSNRVKFHISKGCKGGYCDSNTKLVGIIWVEDGCKIFNSLIMNSYIAECEIFGDSTIVNSFILKNTTIIKSKIYDCFITGTNRIAKSRLSDTHIFTNSVIECSDLSKVNLFGLSNIKLCYMRDTNSYRKLEIYPKDTFYSKINLIPIYNAIFRSDVVINSPEDYIVFNDFESLQHRFVWTKSNNYVQNEVISAPIEMFISQVPDELKPIYQKYLDIIKMISDVPSSFLYHTREEVKIIKNNCKFHIFIEKLLKFLKIKK